MKTPDELIESKVADILVKDGQEWIMRPTTAALMQMYADQFRSAKTTKTYPIICPSCRGAGIVPNPAITYTTTLTILCLACDGLGVVLCTETTEGTTEETTKTEIE
jgi:hypothetical protein